MLEEVYLFLLCFLVVLFVYEIFIVRKAKKKKDYQPIEVKYLISRYHLNMRKVHYPQLLQVVSIVSAFDIAFMVSIVAYVNSYIWQIVSVMVLILPIIMISYHFVGLFYRKRGMTKDE